MYRSYENPWALEDLLEEVMEDYREALESDADEEVLIGLSEYIAELKERINFAWQDDECDSEEY